MTKTIWSTLSGLVQQLWAASFFDFPLLERVYCKLSCDLKPHLELEPLLGGIPLVFEPTLGDIAEWAQFNVVPVAAAPQRGLEDIEYCCGGNQGDVVFHFRKSPDTQFVARFSTLSDYDAERTNVADCSVVFMSKGNGIEKILLDFEVLCDGIPTLETNLLNLKTLPECLSSPHLLEAWRELSLPCFSSPQQLFLLLAALATTFVFRCDEYDTYSVFEEDHPVSDSDNSDLGSHTTDSSDDSEFWSDPGTDPDDDLKHGDVDFPPRPESPKSD
ncbi:uncharacterized protein EV422DRAFT_572018 [Fimicolochytrium jonesii]|uniref:uncharacterized protein n=1 Tax=Fimicolochytrium jonesii TaxID=1396493 RepID=UPI0022FF01A4|nr:uncharacterized protein EV422DRAFT_572018 [Fimicolochytrium jonesii]KAI8816124.1 hypothetical protein EV422DRAFT_572018 [Fimicolochytrium jonesii]